MDNVRSFFRDRFGYKSSVYVIASRLTNYFYAFLKGGLAGVSVIRAGAIPITGKWVKLRTLAHPIFIRPVNEDISSIVNNIFREEYGQVPREFVPKLIVDAGAYIGDTSAYFLSRYPSAKVVALEPNPVSYEIADRNLVAYGDRATLLNAALTPEDGVVYITGFTTGAKISGEGQEVSGMSISTLLSKSKFDSIDILKMDIEGHEVPVLTQVSDDWLPRVKWLLLETHGVHIEHELLPFLEGKGFTIHRHRNVWYCQNSV